jgi:hypothetical protein
MAMGGGGVMMSLDLGANVSARIVGVKVFTMGEVSDRVGKDGWVDIYSCWGDVNEETR